MFHRRISIFMIKFMERFRDKPRNKPSGPIIVTVTPTSEGVDLVFPGGVSRDDLDHFSDVLTVLEPLMAFITGATAKEDTYIVEVQMDPATWPIIEPIIAHMAGQAIFGASLVIERDNPQVASAA